MWLLVSAYTSVVKQMDKPGRWLSMYSSLPAVTSMCCVVLCDVTCTPKHLWHHNFWPPLRHQRLAPPTGGVAAKSFYIPQHNGSSTANAAITTTIVTDPLFRKSSDSRIPIRTLRIHERGKSISRRIIPTERVTIRTSSLSIQTCNLDHLFQWRRSLISLCHERAYSPPTQNGNYQILIWIN